MTVKAIQKLGDFAPRRFARVINRTGATLNKGAIVMLDLIADDGSVDDHGTAASGSTPASQVGSTNHPLSNAVTPTAGGAVTNHYIFGVVNQDSVADDEEMQILIQGTIIADTDGTVVGGDGLYVVDAVRTLTDDTAAATNAMCVGVALQDDNSDNQVFCYFNGLGHGTRAGS